MPAILEKEETKLTPRSLVVRHHPLTSPGGTRATVQTARASQFAMPRTPTTTTKAEKQEQPSRQQPTPSRGGTLLLPLGIGMLCTLLLVLVGSFVVTWSSILIDDLRYGTPRTTQVDHLVGHEVDPHVPTHFTAMNLHGTVMILEVPGGDPQHARMLLGPHLVGPGADLAPITLTFSGEEHHPDLVVTVNTIQIVFHNTGNHYELMR